MNQLWKASMEVQVRNAKSLLVFAAAALMAGCANLDAVREFGKTAAAITAYPDAGVLYEQSARTAKPYDILSSSAPADQPEVRHAQVQRALAAQAAVNAYFSTLAALAGDETFSLSKQVTAVDQSLKGLPRASGDATDIDAAAALANVLQKYLLAEKQASAVKALVFEGGPHAMRILDSLIRTTGDWSREVANDKGKVLVALDALSAGRDTSPLLAMLAKDRRAQLADAYDSSIRKIHSTQEGLKEIVRAHQQMAQSVDKLSPKEWTSLLRGAVADLQVTRKNIEALR